MALTAAEKMKRYRERIKQDSQKYEEYRKKDLERLKRRRKKISELDEAEKKSQRDQWVKQKRKQRANKQNATVVETNTKKEETNELQKKDKVKVETSKLKYLNTKCTKLNNTLKKKEERIKKLLTICEKLKKRNYRLKIDAEKQIQNKEKIIEKMKAREQVLEDTMKKTYNACEKRSQKIILKRLITNAKAKSYVAKLIGLTGKVKKAKPKKVSLVSKELVKFYVRDDVSRCTAGKKECRTYNKEKQQIRYLLDTLQNLYKKYKNEGGKYKFTTFYKYKPFYVLTPHLGSRNTCLCIKHNNIELKFACLKQHSVLLKSNLKEILALQTCDLKSFECMHGKCMKCKNIPIIYNTNVQLNQNVTWYQWETITHKYSKKEGSETTEKTTKKTVKAEKNGTINQLLQDFENGIKPFKKHYFNNIHQQNQYQLITNHLKENEAVVICDFSENYETKLSEEIQSMHFGASKSQITLHTGMVYIQGMSQSFCTVSQNNMHQPPAIWAHLLPVLKMIKDDFKVTTIHFYSDGPTSQYRQKNNFYLIDLFTEKLELEYATWSFFESGHGKGVADGIGGSVKRVLDRQVCFGKDIREASDAYHILKACMKTVKIWFVKDEEINNIVSMLPNNITTLAGTLQIHQIITKGNGILAYRDIGCFCGELKGLCSCFGLKTHCVRSNTKIKDTVPTKPTTSNLPNDELSTPEFTTSILNLPIELVTPENTSENLNLPIELDIPEHTSVNLNLPIKLDIPEHTSVNLNLPIELDIPEHTSENLNLPIELDIPEHTSENLNLPIELDIPEHTSENLNLPMDFDIIDFMYILPETESNSPGPSSVEQKNILNKTVNVMPSNYCPGPSSTKRDGFNCKKGNKCVPKKSINSNAIVSKKHIEFQNCSGCTCSILGKMAKCMACKKNYCNDCVGGPITIDYLCDKCLGDSDSDD